ncbi:hypothetical protein [Corynebacterium amycolatum]|uniref:hypothetical protein n=1 Tax=Corynebacterium amycolatum TaxID=43765 RepID=UPI00223A9C5A|nr:hypothetical protein [Corynebacterium amycolatum]MCT1547063.1 hypothetical protein [Corynebacterium amycolatum]
MTEKTTPEPESKYDDSRRPLLAAARSGTIALAVITVLSLLVWGGKNGMPGVWGVLLGAGISGSFVLLTVLGILFTARTSPSVTLAVVLGGWLLKIVVLIGVLVVIRNLEFYDNMTFFVTVVLTLMVTLGAEVWGMSQSNLTYVQPMKDE